MRTKIKIVIAGITLMIAVLATYGFWSIGGGKRHDWARYRYPVLGVESTFDLRGYLAGRLKNNPNSALEMSALAGAYLGDARRTGDNSLIDEAEKLARKSLRSLPFKNNGAKMILAQAFESRHQFDQAITIALEVQSEDPRNTGAISTLVTCYLGKGDAETAHFYADKLVDMRPGMGSYTLRALVLLARGNDEEGIYNFRRAIALEDIGEVDGSAWLRSLMGRYYLSHGKTETARPLLTEALRIRSKYPLAMKLMGDLEAAEGKSDSAASYYTEAFELSGEPPYLLAHAKLRAKLGDKEGAKRMRAQAEKIIRDEFAAGPYGHASELMQVLLDQGDGEKIAEAVTVARKEMTRRQDALTLMLCTRVLIAANLWAEAKGAVETLLRLGVQDPEVFRAAGKISAKLGSSSQSQFYLQRAAELGS